MAGVTQPWSLSTWCNVFLRRSLCLCLCWLLLVYLQLARVTNGSGIPWSMLEAACSWRVVWFNGDNGFSVPAVVIVELTETLYAHLSQNSFMYSSSCDLLRFEVEPGFSPGRGNASPEAAHLWWNIRFTDDYGWARQPWSLLNWYDCTMINVGWRFAMLESDDGCNTGIVGCFGFCWLVMLENDDGGDTDFVRWDSWC